MMMVNWNLGNQIWQIEIPRLKFIKMYFKLIKYILNNSLSVILKCVGIS